MKGLQARWLGEVCGVGMNIEGDGGICGVLGCEVRCKVVKATSTCQLNKTGDNVTRVTVVRIPNGTNPLEHSLCSLWRNWAVGYKAEAKLALVWLALVPILNHNLHTTYYLARPLSYALV